MGKFDLEKAEYEYNHSNPTYAGSTSYLFTDDIKSNNLSKRTIYIIAAIVVTIVIALSIGLGVGLSKKSDINEPGVKSKQQGTNAPPSSTQVPPSTPGPSPHTPSSTQTPPTTSSPRWVDQPCVSQRPVTCPWSKKPVLLVSLDGFRAEYVLRNYTPVIQKLRTCGVHTPYMRAVYPTLTFPNHYTIITGMYPASTGIVGNNMYDSVINASYSISGNEKSNPAWYSGEPLWTTAKKQGLKTASYFWVGSEYNISGSQPDIWFPYEEKTSFEDRVDTALEWLRSEDRPDFMTLYFNEPDHTAHGNGPDSPQVNAMLRRVDSIIGRLMDGLYRQEMDHCVNLIVLADHGMAPTSCERQVNLNKYMSNDDLAKLLIYSGPTGHINPMYWKKKNSRTVLENNQVQSASEIRDSLVCKSPHLNVYTPDTIPVRHHYTNNRRIGPVVLDVESSWLVYPEQSKSCLKGNHGYDNLYKSMHALFLAHGPSFKESVEAEPFENIELYNLMADLLEIEPAPNNGTRGSLYHMLREPPVMGQQHLTEYQQCGGTHTRAKPPECSCDKMTDYVPMTEVTSNHVPFGLPSNEAGVDLCQLNGRQFVSAYSRTYKMPAWTSFTLTQEQKGDEHNTNIRAVLKSKFNMVADRDIENGRRAVIANSILYLIIITSLKKTDFINDRCVPAVNYNTTVNTCVMPDPRLDDDANPACQAYQNSNTSIKFYNLFDTGYSSNEADRKESRLSSNIVPMYTGFKEGIWDFVSRLIRDYATRFNNLAVTAGPAFDYNFDGLPDAGAINITVNENSMVALPSHYYVILAYCAKSTVPMAQCDATDVRTMTFILPHKNIANNCQTYKQFLHNNVARIRDVELLTGLRFLTRFSVAPGARLRTYLAVEMWQSTVLASWRELPCATRDTSTCPFKSPPLLLVSLDGFRADYLTRKLTPTIQRLADCGVHTPYMRSVYPTVTFPNHYTIVTGLYPESHGIIANNMYDKEIGGKFHLGAPLAMDPRWWKGEPLWITAQKQGLRSGTYFWPGSDVNISGIYPDIYKPYDGKAGFTARVDEVLSWLAMPDESRPSFLTLYFDQPDHAGHGSGPNSEEVNGALQTVDELMDMLMTKLYEKNLHNCINIITIADHGMSAQSCSQALYVKNYAQDVNTSLMFGGVMGNILPQYVDEKDSRYSIVKDRNTSVSISSVVSDMTCRHPAMKVFTKATLPRRHHYTNSDRIGDVLLDMKDEWLVFRTHQGFCTGGNHGWDNTYKSMHALFLAHGPAFKDNYTVEPFENIELYNMMCDVLNITAAPNNGTKGSLNDILKYSPTVSNQMPASIAATCNIASGNLNRCNCSRTDTVSPSAIFSSVKQVPGLPDARSSNNDSVCVLYQSNFIITYSQTMKAPVAIKTQVTDTKPASKWYSNETCILEDTRTGHGCPPSVIANDTELTPLIRSENGEQLDLSSTMLPMYTGFKTGVWRTLLQLLDDYSSLYGSLSITMGPVYDYNNDGLSEGITTKTKFADKAKTMPIPTHIYMNIVKCKDKTKQWPCGYDIDVLTFILPHLQEVPNCLSIEPYLKDNVGRIRDVELLTGLTFTAGLPHSNAVKLRTFLPETIWKSRMFPTWMDEPCPSGDLCDSEYKPLLLVSLDGFRADYLIRNFTPAIKRLSQCGVHAPFMRSVYPTKTFPNHYSIATGLYPESHGIIDNNMYDMDLKLRFSLSSGVKFKSDWWGGEPIWNTVQHQGLKAATYFWPGSDVKIGGQRPSIWKKYDEKVTYAGRVEEVVSWFLLSKDKRPDFVTLYFEEPDHAGHESGPSEIEAIGAALDKVDTAIHELMNGLMRYNMHHCVNIVIVADHGMSDISCDRVVRLGDLVDYDYLANNFWVWDGPVGRISNTYKYKKGAPGGISKNDNPEPIDTLVKNLTCSSPHLNTYTKASLPVRHHYTNNARIDNIILDMEPEWQIARSYIKYCEGGNHGYDNIDKSMEALFLAYGPAFKWNYTVEPFENIELYNLFTEILNVTAAPNNGTMGSLNHLLQNPPQAPPRATSPSLEYVDALDAYHELGDYANYTVTKCNGSCSSQQQLEDLYSKPQGGIGQEPFVIPMMKSQVYANRNITRLYFGSSVNGYDADNGVSLWTSRDWYRTGDTSSTGLPPNWSIDSQKGDGIASIITTWSHKFAAIQHTHRQINVFQGEAYDQNHDSLPDVNLSSKPTHFFTVQTWCADNTALLQDCTEYKTSAYIIPLEDGNQFCKPPEDYLIDVEARVRDVEILTGLELYTNLPFDQAVRLRTFLPQRPDKKTQS